mmetsp:Transcript_7969/g.18331  ORF Transcript_7969/g.18331 Transcript_7969/m.18331 type:complete len:274 (-) Transcript_7969:257-1078(-)
MAQQGNPAAADFVEAWSDEARRLGIPRWRRRQVLHQFSDHDTTDFGPIVVTVAGNNEVCRHAGPNDDAHASHRRALTVKRSLPLRMDLAADYAAALAEGDSIASSDLEDERQDELGDELRSELLALEEALEFQEEKEKDRKKEKEAENYPPRSSSVKPSMQKPTAAAGQREKEEVAENEEREKKEQKEEKDEKEEREEKEENDEKEENEETQENEDNQKPSIVPTRPSMRKRMAAAGKRAATTMVGRLCGLTEHRSCSVSSTRRSRKVVAPAP